MEPKYDNKILRLIQEVYNDYTLAPDELPKTNFFRLMFENKLMDVCDYNIFYLNHYIDELIQVKDYLTYEQFLVLLFFIYGQQLKMLKTQKLDEETFNNLMTNERDNHEEKPENDDKNNELDRELPNDINEMTVDSYKVMINKEQVSLTNNTILKVLKLIREDNNNYVDIVIPDYQDQEKLLNHILTTESINFSKNYSDPLYHIFCGNSSFLPEKNIQLMNISDLIRIIWEKNIYNNIESEVIARILTYFMYPVKINFSNKNVAEKFYNVFDDPKLKNNPDLVQEQFAAINLDSNKINFSFSTFVLIMTTFSMNIPENEGKSLLEALEHFYKTVLEIEINDKFNNMDNINENTANLDDDNQWPESKVLGEAKRMQKNPDKFDKNFLLDSLSLLDKDLPEMSSLIKSTKNSVPTQANNLYNYKYKKEVLKFPLQTLKVELDEIARKKIEDSDKARIEKLKGAKKSSGREPPPKPMFFEELPDVEFEEFKYFGNKTIETLKQRFLKNSFKEIMMNSNVYPCLIKEVMIIPKKLHVEVVETLLLVLKDQVNGKYEEAIAKLEKAEKDYHFYKCISSQADLYFYIMFGNLYESLELNLMSLRYYMKAKLITDKLLATNPDCALVYCNIGSLMIRLREYDWAFRCFWKAKTIREYTIGGDTIDTASIYNNLGVCTFYHQCYYTTNAFFKLSYETLKEKLGIFHQRTMLVKGNMGKMSSLNFNNKFEFKALGLFHTVTIQEVAKKKGKKK